MERGEHPYRGVTWRSLPLGYWLLPLATAVAAVVVWTAWCDSADTIWIGGALVSATGLLVLSLALEAQTHEPGTGALVRRTSIATGLGLAAGSVTFLAAGLGFWLRCPPFG